MKTIQVKDKTFTLSIPESDILRGVSHVAERINKDLSGKNPLFIGVLNGA